ncbi:MAG: hypothetical protein JNG85_16395 [Spirochaetaceae bacterium]|nr:hypothetical protein [Spirochaetaceae bacterium]
MSPPDDTASRRRGAAIHPIRQPSPLQLEEVPGFLENQVIPKLEAIGTDAMGARENARHAAAGAWAANARAGELEVKLENLRTEMRTGFEALRKAIIEAGRQGRERDAEIEKRAAAASTKASGVRTALQSYQDLEAERRKAEELARALEAERDRKRDDDLAALKRSQDETRALIAAREASYLRAAEQGAAEAQERADKLSLKGAFGSAGATQIVTTIIAAMQGQALTYAIGIGLGFGLFVVLFALLVRHFRKASK